MVMSRGSFVFVREHPIPSSRQNQGGTPQHCGKQSTYGRCPKGTAFVVPLWRQCQHELNAAPLAHSTEPVERVNAKDAIHRSCFGYESLLVHWSSLLDVPTGVNHAERGLKGQRGDV